MTNQCIDHQRWSGSRGFTLIEVLVTVAIVAILTSIAVPAYTDYIIRGRIPDATSGLATKRIQSEQYFQDSATHTFADVLPEVNPGCKADTTSGRYFDFKCTVATSSSPGPASFTVEAKGKVGGPMEGFFYYVDQSNVKSTNIVAPALPAWRTTCATAWITKKGEVCPP